MSAIGMPRSCPVPPRRRVRPAHVCLGANPARGREFTRARTELATIHLPQSPSLRRCDRNLPRSRRQMCLGCGLHACAGPDTHADPPATPPGRAATSCAPVLHESHRTSHSRESLAGNRWIERADQAHNPPACCSGRPGRSRRLIAERMAVVVLAHDVRARNPSVRRAQRLTVHEADIKLDARGCKSLVDPRQRNVG